MAKPIAEVLMDTFSKPVNISSTLPCGRLTLHMMDNNLVLFSFDKQYINWFYSTATLKDGTFLDTRKAKRTNYTISKAEQGYKATISYKQDKYELVQNFDLYNDHPYFKASLTVNSKNEFETNKLNVLEFAYPSKDKCKPLFMSLDQKIMLVPYDNDMWTSYSSNRYMPGLTSYELTAIYDDHSLNGLVIGATTFDNFKNAIICNGYDARCYSVVSGISDYGTHDCLPHGYLTGKSITSETFFVGWYDDIRIGLKEYAKIAGNKNMLTWNHPSIFGWNSYSALAIKTTIDHFKQAGDFIKNELPNYCDEDGVTYINLDATFGLDKGKLKKAIDHLHKQGQKVGTYIAPLCHMEIMNMLPLKGSLLKFRKDIILKKPDGTDYTPIDSKLPIDITIPEAEKDLRLQLKDIVETGFDYLKIDFLSHGAVEGVRYNKNIKTGRQAIKYFYEILMDELDSKKINRDIFISLSIAPLFPAGYGHARRMCCDSFGHSQDVRYILNSLTYGFYQNENLYCYNDPDHTVLYNSLVDDLGPTDLKEARSRYNASVISGTVMLLSDNYGPDGDSNIIEQSKARAIQLANNPKLNEVAKLKKSFVPVKMNDTSEVYFLNHNDKTYIAVFNLESHKRDFKILPTEINAPNSGVLQALNYKAQSSYKDVITITLEGNDSVILELTKQG